MAGAPATGEGMGATGDAGIARMGLPSAGLLSAGMSSVGAPRNASPTMFARSNAAADGARVFPASCNQRRRQCSSCPRVTGLAR